MVVNLTETLDGHLLDEIVGEGDDCVWGERAATEDGIEGSQAGPTELSRQSSIQDPINGHNPKALGHH